MDVIIGGYFELNSVNRSKFAESIEPSPDLRIEESTPFQNSSDATEVAVRRDPGLKDGGTINVTIVDNDDYDMLQALYAIQGTKVTLHWRADDAAMGATNPEMRCTVIVPMVFPPVTQGQGARYTAAFAVDGDITLHTS